MILSGRVNTSDAIFFRGNLLFCPCPGRQLLRGLGKLCFGLHLLRPCTIING